MILVLISSPVLQNSIHGVVRSPEQTLSSTSNITLQALTVSTGVTKAIRILKLYEIYTEASSSNTGVTIQVGIPGQASKFYSGTSVVNAAAMMCTIELRP